MGIYIYIYIFFADLASLGKEESYSEKNRGHELNSHPHGAYLYWGHLIIKNTLFKLNWTGKYCPSLTILEVIIYGTPSPYQV